MDLDKALQSCDQCIATNDSQQMLTTLSHLHTYFGRLVHVYCEQYESRSDCSYCLLPR